MKGRCHTPEQIVLELHDADALVAEGKTMAVVRGAEQPWRSNRSIHRCHTGQHDPCRFI